MYLPSNFKVWAFEILDASKCTTDHFSTSPNFAVHRYFLVQKTDDQEPESKIIREPLKVLFFV